MTSRTHGERRAGRENDKKKHRSRNLHTQLQPYNKLHTRQAIHDRKKRHQYTTTIYYTASSSPVTKRREMNTANTHKKDTHTQKSRATS